MGKFTDKLVDKIKSLRKLTNEINDGGAVFFGIVIGWITYATFHFNSEHGVKELAAIVGVIGGAAVTRLFSKTETQFAMYCVGLASGFFTHALWLFFIILIKS